VAFGKIKTGVGGKREFMKTKQWMRMGVVMAACAVALTFAADEKSPEKQTDSSAGDTAWRELQKSFRPPAPPTEWRTNEPTKQQIAEFEKQNGVLAGEAADKAKDFYTKFPSHPRATEAQRMELQLLGVAVELGATNRQTAFDALEEKRLNDPTLPADEKFNLRAERIMKILMEGESTNRAPALAKAEGMARDLQAEFPKREENNDLLLMIAQGYVDSDQAEKARVIIEDVAKKASGDAKEQAEMQLRKLNLLGKPLDLNFTDSKGKEQSIKNYAGKVVLVDFWATWCGPCRAALPEVKEVYSKYRGKGFEIIGISFDNDKDALNKFIAEEGMSWPQYVDELGRENKIGSKYEIGSIPTMWLVDKKGNLRDLSGGQSLAAKVEKLLAEK
jgi:thiol-disulfide isomerase/thioredoxin